MYIVPGRCQAGTDCSKITSAEEVRDGARSPSLVINEMVEGRLEFGLALWAVVETKMRGVLGVSCRGKRLAQCGLGGIFRNRGFQELNCSSSPARDLCGFSNRCPFGRGCLIPVPHASKALLGLLQGELEDGHLNLEVGDGARGLVHSGGGGGLGSRC